MSAPEPDQKPIKARSLLGVLRFLVKYRWGAVLAISLLLVNLTIEMSLPQILGTTITQLREYSAGKTDFPLRMYLELFVSLVVIRAGVGFILGPVRNRVIQRTLGDIRAAIYDAIQRLSFTYHDKSNSGELISRSTTDVWRLQDFFYACLLLTLDIAIALITTIALIFACSPLLGFVTLATTIPTIALIIFYAGKLQPQWRKVHDLHGAMTTVIQENIAGVRVVKAFARENAEIARFQARKDAFIETMMRTVNYWASRVPLAQFIFGLSTPLILWLGGRLVIQGVMPIGDLAKVVFYLMAIGNRVGAVGQYTNIIQNASASSERILEIVREPQKLRSGSLDLLPGPGEVRFENVSFNYQPGKPSLVNVSFVAEPGRTVAILGPTGSGKTTLVNLIPRFYEVSNGAVFIDGVDVRQLKLEHLRRSVGVIFQETFLFSTTVAENIAYGMPDATREQIEKCAQLAQAHDFITELENGYDTVIGERGISLSGGQRQRIAIARAFLMNPRILILDDATASVDARTERLIQEAMRRLVEGRTTFVIAHRVSTVQHADQILVLKAGSIVQQGTHAELSDAGGFYQEVFEEQVQLA